MACECYKSAPQQMPNCTGSPCHIILEARQLSTPEGKARWREAYHAELAERAKAYDDGPSRRESLQWLGTLGLPGVALSFATHPDMRRKAMVAAERFWKGERGLVPGFVLPGPVGVGKTVAACWVCLQWASSFNWRNKPTGDRGLPLMWLDNSGLTKIGGFDGESARLLDDAERAGLFVVDDAAKEHTRTAVEALSDVMRARLDNRKLTVLTTQAPAADFRTRYGEALADRLKASSVIADLRGEKSMRGAA